ncbi:heme-binding protein [Burkholderia sp. 22PA0106]|uniref:heme-binding protein n=1 Tax=Burkholderia sp. 22PA0106 TaxID=3237371 RepID=UPI0039C24333
MRWQTAQALAAEAVHLCAGRRYSVTATVVDPSGHPQAVVKGDSVPLQSLSVSYARRTPPFPTAWPSTRTPRES